MVRELDVHAACAAALDGVKHLVHRLRMHQHLGGTFGFALGQRPRDALQAQRARAAGVRRGAGCWPKLPGWNALAYAKCSVAMPPGRGHSASRATSRCPRAGSMCWNTITEEIQSKPLSRALQYSFSKRQPACRRLAIKRICEGPGSRALGLKASKASAILNRRGCSQ